MCHALYSEDPKYYVIPTVTDTYIPQDNAVSLNRRQIQLHKYGYERCVSLL